MACLPGQHSGMAQRPGQGVAGPKLFTLLAGCPNLAYPDHIMVVDGGPQHVDVNPCNVVGGVVGCVPIMNGHKLLH